METVKGVVNMPTTVSEIIALANPLVHNIGGNPYVVDKNGDYEQVRPEIDMVKEKQLNSLDALVQMVKTEASDVYSSQIYIEAKRYNEIECFLRPDVDARYIRPILYSVSATDVPGWDVKDAMPFEEFLIALRTRFQQTPDTEYLLRLLSDITNGAKVTYADNGVAMTVVSQKGVALQGTETIRPIISLRPYRTFQELEQPVSEFHLRIGERGIRLIDADGGMWKLTARKSIVAYLREHLESEISNGRVVVML